MAPRSHLSRRDVLRQGAWVVGVAATAPAFLRRLARADDTAPAASDSVLVVLELSGGNDGLSTVVPRESDELRRARPTLGFRDEDLLPIDERIGLHPDLRGLAVLHARGRLAIVQGVGYPDPSRSHFESMDVWHTADLGGRRSPTGWVGRAGDAMPGGTDRPCLVVGIGSRQPYALEARVRHGVSFADPERFQWNGSDPAFERLHDSPPAADPAPAARLREVARDALAASEAVQAAARRYRPRVEYPDTKLARDLSIAAGLVDAGLGTRIVYAACGGFDTHVGQAASYPERMREVDGALSAFLGDVEAHGHGERVAVMAFSEFGRRVAENGSGGTDHGAAGPMFLAGGRVRGGLHGDPPRFEALDRGDLVASVDFRSVYRSAVEDFLGIPAEGVIDGSVPRLSLFAT